MVDRYKERIKILVIVAIVSLIFVVAVMVFASTRAPEKDVQSEQPVTSSGSTQQAENETAFRNQFNVLLCGVDESEMLTDVIMLACFDMERSSVTVLQIPRDTFIGFDYPTGKINSVYSLYENNDKGIEKLEDLITEQFKIPIDYHAIITLDTFVDFVNDIGGVEITIPKEIAQADGMPFKIGTQVINGEEAELLVRFRSGYVNADLGRMNAQRIFLTALVDTVRSKNIAQILSLITKNYNKVQTDLTLPQILNVVKVGLNIDLDSVEFYTVPGSGVYIGGYAVYTINEEELATLLNAHFLSKEDQVDDTDLNFPQQVDYPVYDVPQEQNESDINSVQGTEIQDSEDFENSDAVQTIPIIETILPPQEIKTVE